MPGPSKNLPFEYTTRWQEISDMLETPLPPEAVAVLEQRDRELEDHLMQQPMVYTRVASVTAFRSVPWTAKARTQIKGWSVEVDQLDNGTDDVQGVDVDIELHVNGVLEVAMTLPAGDPIVYYEGRLPKLNAGARVTVYCEQTGFVLISTVDF